jgi:drug/metabolite transporter (DMT)-like permease
MLRAIPWWALQIAAGLMIFTSHVVNRRLGLCLTSYLYYSLISVCFTAWMLPLSYQKAPSFFQPWFLGLITLNVFGMMGSVFYFHETVNWYNWLGALISILGCVLIAL